MIDTSIYFGEQFEAFHPFGKESGAEVVKVGPELTPEMFAQLVGSMSIPQLHAQNGEIIPARAACLSEGLTIIQRDQSHPRHSWLPDHRWHAERSAWGEAPVATVLYAKEIVGPAAGTDLINTALLFEAVVRDNPTLEDELKGAMGLFTVERYFLELLPNSGASQNDLERIAEEFGASNLEERAAIARAQRPPKVMPITPVHAFSGKDSLVIDELRLDHIVEPFDTARGLEIIEAVRRNYLDLPEIELYNRPYFYRHTWNNGEAFVIPEADLHRACPSPAEEQSRTLYRQFVI